MDNSEFPIGQRYKDDPIQVPLPVDGNGDSWHLDDFLKFQQCWERIAGAFLEDCSEQSVSIQVLILMS